MILRCSWCGAPNPSHEGGATRQDGGIIQGNFCNRECYDRWLHAHSIMDVVIEGQRRAESAAGGA